MSISPNFDRTGFPLLPIKHLRLSVQLLPVTKYQIEAWLADSAARR